MSAETLIRAGRAIDTIILVRGRKVGYSRSNWGGDLVAVERGHFPVSHTGYRSQGGQEPPSTEAFEALAVARDQDYADTLRRCQKAMRTPAVRDPRHPRCDFISMTMAAEAALARGFFAEDDMRRQLWQAAYRVYDRIRSNEVFHPEPTNACLNPQAWTPEYCAGALREVVASLLWLKELLRGNLTKPVYLPINIGISVSAYFDLPERPEPIFELPVIETDFGFEASPIAKADDDEFRADDGDEIEAESDHHEDADADDEESREGVAAILVRTASDLAAPAAAGLSEEAQLSLF
jgi:hypothetical protein